MIDTENDGQPNSNASGDDTGNLPDEDGITFDTLPLIPGQPAQVTVTRNPWDWPNHMSAWIDFNYDGNWDTPGDCIFVSQLLTGSASALTFQVPATAAPNVTTFARFRLHNQSHGVGYLGWCSGGEVEDYAVQIGEPPPTGACCHGSPPTTCVVTTQHDCVYHLSGQYMGDGSACDDANSDGVADVCESLHPCCYGELGGSCLITTIENCTSLGGSFEESMDDCVDTNTDGIPDACEQSARVACCWRDGLCVMQPPGPCSMIGGTPQPFGSVCTEILMACCLGNGLCIVTEAACCEMRGGHPSPTGQTECLGDQNSNGRDDACESPQGCCLADGTCVILTPIDCAAQQGIALGEGSSCTGVQQVCCMSDGSCRVVDTACCAALGGSPSPTGASACLGDQNGDSIDDACEVPQGCCQVDGTCVMARRSECLAQQGMPLGEGSSCTGTSIACCMSDASCRVVERACCEALGGTPSPTGASACQGDQNDNGIDDACDFPPGPTWSQPPAPDGQGFSAVSDFWWNEPLAIVFWDQPPSVQWPGLTSHDYDVGSGLQSTSIACKWLIDNSNLVEVVWWGNYEEDDEGNEIRGAGIQAFRVSIHKDKYHRGLPDDPPVLAQTFPFAAADETDTGQVNVDGCTVYQYRIAFQYPFVPAANDLPWLEITAQSNNLVDPPIWRWQEQGRPQYGGYAAMTAEKRPSQQWHAVIWPPVPPETFQRYSRMSMRLYGLGFGPEIEVNRIVADDFKSDGRRIDTLKWWGCYFENSYRPNYGEVFHRMDGWFITFYSKDPNAWPGQAACPPIAFTDTDPSVLGVYFVQASDVNWTETNARDCSNRLIYAYNVDLDQCTLLCSFLDPRTQTAPAQVGSFDQVTGLDYWLGIQAVTGAMWSGATSTLADRVLTGHVASNTTSDGHFWNWMTSPGATTPWPSMQEACVGRIANMDLPPPSCWNYGGWSKAPWNCAAPAQPVQMAFELGSSIGDGLQACCLGDEGCIDTTGIDCFFVHGKMAQGAGTACDRLALTIDGQPVDTEACVGWDSVLTVVPCGRGPFSYQWWKEGEPPTPVGVDDNHLIFESVTEAAAGSYYVDVSEPGSAAIRSESAMLSLSEPVSGDCDRNCVLNGADIQSFVDALVSGALPSCADMDSNGVLEMADAWLLVNTLLGT